MNNVLQKILKPSARGRMWQIFGLIIVLIIVGGLIDAGNYYNKGSIWLANKTNNIIKLPGVKEIPFRLGLDLQGGAHLVYQADVVNIPSKDRSNAIEGARDVIERRVNVFGVSEPVVQVNKTAGGDYRIVVELAGVKDINEAIKIIGETPILEFKQHGDQQRELTDEEKKIMEDFNKTAEEKASEVLGKALSRGDFGALAKEYSQDEKTKEANGDLGWITNKESPEFIDVVQNMKTGEITNDLIKTNYGYEIIKLEDKRIKKDPFTEKEEKQIKASHLLLCYKESEGCQSDSSKEEVYEKIKEIKKQANTNNFSDLVKKHSTEPGADQSGGELGWFGRGNMVKPFEDAVFEQKIGTISYVVATKFGYHLIYKQDEKNIDEYKISHILIRTINKQDILGATQDWQNTELSGKDLKRATVQFNPNDNSPEVGLEFNKQGSNLFEEITNNNINKQVAIFLDGYLISAPTVNEKITGGKAVISGKFNLKEAKLLVQRLNAGALPVPISLVSQKTVGPSLGSKSVSNSLRAGIIGLILIALFMILFYRINGLLAVISLCIYGTLVLAVFKLWPVTLTLSGIAGFILSIGMAVDANVLIFERIKEELKAGRSRINAVEEGFHRAWPSIRDGNISTLITCFILIQFSTSIVKGFAITLTIGIIISLFSAIIVTKNLLMLRFYRK
ncbi:protein translocase subunit SecD [Patescibacteria group bacterium]|nr:protein translocase subunit SecD [Patescibacteria group bacterium]